jgi:hypothetical protein
VVITLGSNMVGTIVRSVRIRGGTAQLPFSTRTDSRASTPQGDRAQAFTLALRALRDCGVKVGEQRR